MYYESNEKFNDLVHVSGYFKLQAYQNESLKLIGQKHAITIPFILFIHPSHGVMRRLNFTSVRIKVLAYNISCCSNEADKYISDRNIIQINNVNICDVDLKKWVQN